ncbi:CgeB family protein [Elongatibacter sediminis]|uniref:Glycosyltransferase n=1 Tax=Elongatibacter sediminis TaxID=3119006 RepID=A0AAW9RGP9_9GAMM
MSRTFSFRSKAGALVRDINARVEAKSRSHRYDLVWIDKGVYLWPRTVVSLRQRAGRLVHYTPDTAFHANRSRHFRASAELFDLLVTTKAFELEHYETLVPRDRVLLTTQAYDSRVHMPSAVGARKEPVVTFIGLSEAYRRRCIESLLSAGITVRLGGQGWKRFRKRHKGNGRLEFLGERIFGDDYAAHYSAASVGLGLLSRRFPELHTTRTFEIPACGTVLATEKTADTRQFFTGREAVFFNSFQDLVRRIRALMADPARMEELARNGRRRVLADGRDCESVLRRVLERVGLPC